MARFRILTALTVIGMLFSTSTVKAADRHHHISPNLPGEAGQGAFAALSEIVAILETDPKTDWATVDLSALREHLVDMNQLTLTANIDEKPLDGGLAIAVSGAGRTIGAIHRMVPAHAAELDGMPIWSASAKMETDGAILTVTSSEPSMQIKIQALGFFGLMATGSHHQAHHLAIAKGLSLHRHR